MSVWESVRMALRSLRANTLRASLTMLGIIIGTGAVIALLAVGQGAQQTITEQVQSIGANLIFVFPGTFDASGPQVQARGAPAPLTREDGQAVLQDPQTLHVAAVAPEVNRNATLTHRGLSTQVQVVGTNPDYQWVRNVRPLLGDFFSAGDDAAAARVVLLGSQTARDIFGDETLALDQTVRINQIPFRVIGVLEPRGGGPFGSRDNLAVMPLGTANSRLFGGRYVTARGTRVDLLNFSAVNEASMDVAIAEITDVLRFRHNIQFEEDTFTVASQQDILSVFNEITTVLTIFLAAIAGISLLVGGIGIMNIMLVSVTERTREIGIRKAVGAKRAHILAQFLVESVILSILGGAIGIGVGWGLSSLVNRFGAFESVVSLQAVALAVSFSVLVGLFFGIYPASRAAKLHPIEALRYE